MSRPANLTRRAGHAHLLVRRLDELRAEQGIGAQELAVRAGVGRTTITHWHTRTNPHLPLFEAALNALGYRLAIVPARDAD